jgi:hypothetical protein
MRRDNVHVLSSLDVYAIQHIMLVAQFMLSMGIDMPPQPGETFQTAKEYEVTRWNHDGSFNARPTGTKKPGRPPKFREADILKPLSCPTPTLSQSEDDGSVWKWVRRLFWGTIITGLVGGIATQFGKVIVDWAFSIF